MRSGRPRLRNAELLYRRALRASLRELQAAILRILRERTDAASPYSEALKRIRRLRLVVEEGEIDVAYGRVERAASAWNKGLIGIAPAVSKRVIAGFRREQVDLIRRLQGSQLDRVAKILREGAGLRVEEIAAQLQESFGIESRHADLIARDQVVTLNAKITRDQHQKAGIERYRWSSSKDERVREEHADLDGEIFSYDDPPVIDASTGDRGHPGDAIQCRCVAVPVLDWLED